MKKSIVLALFSLMATAAHANASLNLSCADDQNKFQMTVLSGKDTSVVFFNDTAWTGPQLIAGSEGGPMYIQTVNNGAYNLVIEGGELESALNGPVFGKTSFSITIFDRVETKFNGTCSGYMEIDTSVLMGI